jgi:hypothetical protein
MFGRPEINGFGVSKYLVLSPAFDNVFDETAALGEQ